ncbi:hypothetical protein D3C81_1504090 [compost metagenome]
MEVNITALARNLRLFAAPTGLVLISFFVSLSVGRYTPGSNPIWDSMMLTIGPVLAWASLVGLVVGGCWYSFNLWQLHRWENGTLVGSCDRCGGPVSHLDGRYGAYSKCKMCGGTRSGWH